MKYEDTLMSPQARKAYEAAMRRLTPERKLALASRMRERMKALALAGVRLRHPEYDEEQLQAEARREMAPWSK